MRSSQMMRHGRRMTSTSNEWVQMKQQSLDSSSAMRRYSTSFFTNKPHRDSQSSNEHNPSLIQRRNTLQSSFEILSRRFSVQQKDIADLEKSKKNIRNFYVFFLLLFVFLFFSVLYSFIRMMRKSI